MADFGSLPYLPERTSYSHNKSSGVVTVALDGGATKTRKDVESGTSIVSCLWELDRDQYRIFMLFYRTIAKEGAATISANLLLDKAELENVNCRFVPNSLSLSNPSYNLFQVSGQLEVDNQGEDSIEFSEFIDYANEVDPEGFQQLMLDIETFVNTDLEM